VSIFGIAGACRREEFLKMSTKDIEDTGSILVVKIPDTKTNKPRTFVIDGRDHDIKNMVEIYIEDMSPLDLHIQNMSDYLFFIEMENVPPNQSGLIPLEKYLVTLLNILA
jgi:hypothetical protein